MGLCSAQKLQSYLQRLASTGQIFVFRYPGNIVRHIVDDRFLSTTRVVAQVQGIQGHIVIFEEILHRSDSYVVAAAHNFDVCICKKKKKSMLCRQTLEIHKRTYVPLYIYKTNRI